ncbi:unnamed protein product [Bursaphelenchus okinawaensis]|uniref:Mitochondrial import inner membrane translocase subunit TIM17 n=1 Tax=Bursaphelenchus okinawaensis TaxID=465554 RepID=A0A811L1P3_9BILA|nr:unnamed protein product [Bursaphelenchus okinawaensis]CAG9115286.1 unnamed protein product [Bursaphelenchus okinawaensis]
MDEYTREPCPYRIFDDIGSAFCMGLIGGSIFHSVSAYRNAAKNKKLVSMFAELRLKSPLTGGQFSAWGGMFSTIDCTLVAIRKKEDSLNPIASGSLTGAILSIRSGPRIMAGSAILGGTVLAMIEGMGVLMSRYMGSMYDPTQQQMPEDPSQLPMKKEPEVRDESGSSEQIAPFGIPKLSL